MPSKREKDDKGTKTESKRSRFGDKKQSAATKEKLEKARRILELADKLKQNPLLQALKEGKTPLPPKRTALQSQEAELAEARGLKFFDPNIVPKADRSRRRQLSFIEQGEFEQEAELERLRLKYGDDVADRVGQGQVRGLRGVRWEDIQRYLDAGQKKYDLEDIKEELLNGPVRDKDDMEISDDRDSDADEEIPDLEWWDQNILQDGCESYPEEPFPIKSSRIGLYIEHPVPLDPPGEAAPPPPQPLKLTKKEMKKLRTQRRQQREKEKQELIKQGLLEPPKPKVKLSNMMRVLAEETAADPTAIEKEIRKQMLERRKAHEDRNLARKLTPGERRSKNLKKLFSDETRDNHVCVFKVKDLADPRLQFKVTVNAEENRLTGCCLLASPFCLVVVEGGHKATNRYKKLMLRRIRWEERTNEDQMETENSCHLVWEGYAKEKAFEDFKMDECRSEGIAKRYLTSFGVCHYWDLAKSFVPEDPVKKAD